MEFTLTAPHGINGTTAVRRRLLGAALRRYRQAVGYGLAEAASVLECDRSKISRIETGQRGIRARDLRDLLAEYGAGEREQAFLAAIASPGRGSGWWRDYRDVVAGDWLDMMIMESLAAQIFIYHTQQVPALLQTGEYATAIASADSSIPAPGARNRAVEALLARQEAVLGVKERAFTAIIAEAALRQQVGGPGIMRTQLTRLAELSKGSSHLTLRVLPFTVGAHPALDVGGLTILTFTQAPDLGIVHLPGISGGFYLEDSDDVSCYASAFLQIRDAALSTQDSAALLRRMAAE